ncbi:MAG: sigma factor-like helix-turn-helix DNA-binding protein, partial [Ruthenibacterium sp.]
ADILNISRSYVSRIEKKALEQLKRELENANESGNAPKQR